jgi:hypothetical protein
MISGLLQRIPGAALAALMALAVSNCGGIADEIPSSEDAGRRRDAARDTNAPDRAEAGDAASHDGSDADGALPVYVEDACPPSVPDPPDYECDPFGTDAGQCQPGYGCYPYPPQGTDPCNPGSWGARCQTAGTGTQGASCNGSRSYCAGGYVCVKSGAGDQCVKLCRIQQLEPCADGLVCNPLDVFGFGGCL